MKRQREDSVCILLGVIRFLTRGDLKRRRNGTVMK